jgi:hypothetical protein
MLQAGTSRVQVPMRWIFLNLLNSSGLTMALGSTQPLTEMSTRNLKKKIIRRNLGLKCGRRIGLTTLPSSISLLSKLYGRINTIKCGSFNLSQSYGSPWPVTWICVYVRFYYCIRCEYAFCEECNKFHEITFIIQKRITVDLCYHHAECLYSLCPPYQLSNG